MSAIATIDTEWEVDQPSVENVGRFATFHRRRITTQQMPLSAPLIWGFDEMGEKTRYDRIQKRLIRLEAALFEEFGARIDRQSKECLLRLFISCPSVSAPSISAQPNGTLTATWRHAGRGELTVRCIDSQVIHFALASNVAGYADRMDRQWGTVHSPCLFFSDNLAARRIASPA